MYGLLTAESNGLVSRRSPMMENFSHNNGFQFPLSMFLIQRPSHYTLKAPSVPHLEIQADEHTQAPMNKRRIGRGLKSR